MKDCRTRFKDGKRYYEYFYETGEYKDGIDYAYPATVNDYRKNSLMYSLPDGTKTNLAGKIDFYWPIWEKM